MVNVMLSKDLLWIQKQLKINHCLICYARRIVRFELTAYFYEYSL